MPLKPGYYKGKAILHRAMSEVFHKTPRVVAKTARKFGKARAEKQRVAIGLAKARRAGARIPRK